MQRLLHVRRGQRARAWRKQVGEGRGPVGVGAVQAVENDVAEDQAAAVTEPWTHDIHGEAVETQLASPAAVGARVVGNAMDDQGIWREPNRGGNGDAHIRDGEALHKRGGGRFNDQRGGRVIDAFDSADTNDIAALDVRGHGSSQGGDNAPAVAAGVVDFGEAGFGVWGHLDATGHNSSAEDFERHGGVQRIEIEVAVDPNEVAGGEGADGMGAQRRGWDGRDRLRLNAGSAAGEKRQSGHRREDGSQPR